jgi:hypothetical protein
MRYDAGRHAGVRHLKMKDHPPDRLIEWAVAMRFFLRTMRRIRPGGWPIRGAPHQKTSGNRHGGPVEHNLMFAGHAAFRFKSDPFYSNGFVPTVKQLVDRF